MKLVCVGEVMGELRSGTTGYAVGFAGDTFNTAVYCRRSLGPEHEVAYVTRLGVDPLSVDCRAFALSEGLDVSFIYSDRVHNIGLYAVKTDERGERSFSYWRSQSAARHLFEDETELTALDGADILYLSAITLAILSSEARQKLLNRIKALRGRGSLFAFDSNYRPALWESRDEARRIVGEAWQLADIGFPSVDDEMALFGDRGEEAVLLRLRGSGCKRGALKRGEEGPRALDPDLGPLPLFPKAERVVDTTAAGDSFNGAYLAAFAMGRDERTCIAEAHDLARHVVTLPGAIVAMPK
ncbi:sugar kinase [Rhizobium alvei]|uniref:Sugar kinase n=1 Tax=Rhizobium alvei TaxID=1132659 RepID=A0ABT8YIP6_9HYPH|nr:sugar kinase [Rhizobium alvei]MDO6963115.1 sugar kinase [Rhizobium alvei]